MENKGQIITWNIGSAEAEIAAGQEVAMLASLRFGGAEIWSFELQNMPQLRKLEEATTLEALILGGVSSAPKLRGLTARVIVLAVDAQSSTVVADVIWANEPAEG